MRNIDIRELVDEARFNGFHALILLWCTLIIVFDGYDLAVAGIALPSIMKEMSVNSTSAGLMVSSALLGMMIGAIIFGTASDRVGRRPVIPVCIVLFSVFTAAAGFATDPVTFSCARFLAGLGIGGVMPNVVAQMAEYSPRRIRSMMVTVMFSGYAVGGMLAAILGKNLIESYGWQSVFIAAGAPVLLAPLIMMFLPESISFLGKTNRLDELKRIAAKLEPSYAPLENDHILVPDVGRTANAPIRSLFQEGRGFSTVMFWVVFFACLFMAYALSSWLTKLMANAGHSFGSAMTFVLILNFGAIVGAIGGGWLADRFHIKHVLVIFFALAAGSISLLGYKVPTAILYVLVGTAGATTIGTQILAYAYVGQFYPMAVRSTGIGWASGIGRNGAILAPILIGALVARNLSLQQSFFVIAIPALVALVAVSLVNNRRAASASHQRADLRVSSNVRAGSDDATVTLQR